MNLSTEYETPIAESLPMDENEEEEDDDEVCIYRCLFRRSTYFCRKTVR